jgi:hypothetical protein
MIRNYTVSVAFMPSAEDSNPKPRDIPLRAYNARDAAAQAGFELRERYETITSTWPYSTRTVRERILSVRPTEPIANPEGT